MNDYREAMHATALATEPTDARLERVRARVMAGLVPATDLLHQVEDPLALQAAQARVRARIGASTPRPRSWAPLAAGPALLAAAAAGVFVVLQGAPREEGHIVLDDATPTIALSPHIQLEHRGRGDARGQGDRWELAWEAGTLSGAVVPEAGVDLVIHTREADIAIVGTAFDVSRDPLGTTVEVSRGKVAVRCLDGSGDAAVGGGEQHTCGPVDAAGHLGRAQALLERGEQPEEVLATLERGLELDDAVGAVRGELLAARVGPLATLGRIEDALVASEAYLEVGGARTDELQRYAARAALTLHGCERALPHLRALTSPDADEKAALDDCVVEVNSER